MVLPKNLNLDPVVVVGQPRSGSTLLTRILNEAPSVFVINDFYVLQKIDAYNLWGCLTASQATTVAGFVFDRIVIRATQETEKTLEQSILLDSACLATVHVVASGPWEKGLFWSDVLARIMREAATASGCCIWGWNTPQDYHHLERIFEAFPGAKIIYQLRGPSAVLSSYKNVSGPWHDSKRYNPIAIGLAWKAAAGNYSNWVKRCPKQIIFLRYEDIVTQTDAALVQISTFLDVDFPRMSLDDFGRNTSHTGGSIAVTPSEIALVQLVVGGQLKERGFAHDPRGRLRPVDFLEICRLFCRSGGYLIKTVLTDTDRRKRLLRLIGVKN
ncbi:MAG: sulfotransferase [Desulfobacteraceae bacterium]|nr:sulfotransferase [Desulfobacteraceae bacterium]